ncbi:hypothetical protein PtA15_8A692 [Puccinia triticina]|uniref:Uncharacterized protein n=1 Tax=Puccinia triticina TaxID=208348 RepID=A0ABY7CR92_9BASI|nr:uncharacterized protein PtA15_8A692 [Puccinia triticina]WAQ87786.1 hypothetical protein PtA15_8A692 [Puccinia triticina]
MIQVYRGRGGCPALGLCDSAAGLELGTAGGFGQIGVMRKHEKSGLRKTRSSRAMWTLQA